jgi:diadenosine tetraphosphate (Ap4A) HIT family hydrolase
LNAFPYGSGHLLVLPRRHVAGSKSSPTTSTGLLLDAAPHDVVALEAAYGPTA